MVKVEVKSRGSPMRPERAISMIVCLLRIDACAGDDGHGG